MDVSEFGDSTPVNQFEAGRLLLVNHGDGDWQELVILRHASVEAYQNNTVPPVRPFLPFWVANPEGDIFPEDLAVPPLTGRIFFSDCGTQIERLVGIGPAVRMNSSRRFAHGRAIGRCSALFFARAVLQADAIEEQTAVRVAASRAAAVREAASGPLAE